MFLPFKKIIGYVSKHFTKDTVNKLYMFEMADKILVTFKRR
jgi:hypothetical protein